MFYIIRYVRQYFLDFLILALFMVLLDCVQVFYLIVMLNRIQLMVLMHAIMLRPRSLFLMNVFRGSVNVFWLSPKSVTHL